MSADPVRQICGEAGAAPGIEALDRVEDQELRVTAAWSSSTFFRRA
ncbi:MAG: hypothetical protein M3Q74_05625 [Pseudomonadota bacterium]|nr:hypothetical protein [Pseudomonadota bacterium]